MITSDLSSAFFDQNQIILLHIPKTAGTSLKAMMRAHLPPEEFCQLPKQGMTAEDIQKCFFHGHLTYWEAPPNLRGPNHRYMAFLRDPVERAVSDYFHMRSHAPDWVADHGTPIHKLALALSPEDFFAEAETVAPTLSLFQTRYFLDDPALQDDPQKALDRATAMMDQFWFIGLSEQFEASAEAFFAQMGLPNPGREQDFFVNAKEHKFDPNDARHKVGFESEDILTEAIYDRLDALTQWDQKLYQHGLEIAKAKGYAQTPDPEAALRKRIARLEIALQARDATIADLHEKSQNLERQLAFFMKKMGG